MRWFLRQYLAHSKSSVFIVTCYYYYLEDMAMVLKVNNQSWPVQTSSCAEGGLWGAAWASLHRPQRPCTPTHMLSPILHCSFPFSLCSALFSGALASEALVYHSPFQCPNLWAARSSQLGICLCCPVLGCRISSQPGSCVSCFPNSLCLLALFFTCSEYVKGTCWI